jgi:PKD repeat protein
MVARVLRVGPVRVLAAVLALASLAACDTVPLTAPTESTITLFAAGSTVPLNGSLDLIATVTESAGTPVHNGTVVTFTTTLGRVEPAEARTQNGRVNVRLVADARSGTARVVAFSGAAVSEPLELLVGAAAAESLSLRADPPNVGVSGGTVQLVALVRDGSGNAVSGVPVTFTANAGQLGNSTAATNDAGEARTTLTTTRETEVTARAGSQEATATIQVIGAPTVSVTASPTTPGAGDPVVFSITVTPATGGNPIQSVTIDYGDGQQQSLGTGSTTAGHVYSQPGTYTVTVRVRDVAGQESSQVLVIVVEVSDQVFPVTLSASTTTPTTGQLVAFTAVASPESGISVQRYEWDFGTGEPIEVTTTNTVTHVFSSTGVFTVRVTAVGSDGSRGTGTRTITVVTP